MIDDLPDCELAAWGLARPPSLPAECVRAAAEPAAAPGGGSEGGSAPLGRVSFSPFLTQVRTGPASLSANASPRSVALPLPLVTAYPPPKRWVIYKLSV
jgi:hypothetical protein